jgi:tRNA pseudouridine65 synthase
VDVASSSVGLRVLWQDHDLVVVDKPAGMLVHNSAWAGPPEPTVVDLARATVDGALVPVHRLDRGTSGALCLARSGAAARTAQAALGDPAACKQYVAVVRGHVRDTLEVDHPLDDDDEPGSARRPARSQITPLLLSPRDRCSLVVVRLFTGRRHQARRHCKHASHPVLGDATHGKGPLNRAFRERWGLARLGLHCARLALPLPAPAPWLDVVAPLPDDLRRPLGRLFPDVDVDGAVAGALGAVPAA